MNTSRTDYSRMIDWSAVKSPDNKAAMRRQILRFVGGIRGERKNEVTKKQILAWFRATPPDFVDEAIWDALREDEIDVRRTALLNRRANGRSVYELTDKGRAVLAARSSDDGDRHPTCMKPEV